MLHWMYFFHFSPYLVVFWSNRAPGSLNRSSKLTFVEKDSCQDENKNLIDKYENKPFDEAPSETHDTSRGDKPPPVIFPSRKLYTETDKIWFENINSIYLREEMRCWVRGGAAGLKHNRNQTPQRRQARRSPRKHTKTAFLCPLRVYFAIRLLFCVLVQLRYGRGDKENEVEAGGGNVRNHNTGTWPLCELLLHDIRRCLGPICHFSTA